MAVNSTNLTQSATITDSEFRAIVDFIANTLQSGGVTKTADSGQINTATVTWPALNSTIAGYEIRQFTDALAGTDPVKIKISYGRGGAAGQFAMWFEVGTGSDGSGNITGVKMATTAQLTLNTAAATKVAYVSATTNRFCFALGADATTGGYIGMERTLDVNKAVTNRGILFFRKTSNANVTIPQFIDFQGTSPAVETSGGCLPPSGQLTGVHSSGDVGIYPCYFFGIGEVLVPGTNFAGAFSAEFTGGNQYTINVLGVDQNMLCLPVAMACGIQRNTGAPSNAQFTAMMRYE